MEADRYDEVTASTSIYGQAVEEAFTPENLEAIKLYARVSYLAGKMNGEAGEVAEEIFKALRDEQCRISPERRGRILKECSDVLFYLSRVAHELDSSFAELLEMSADKLLDHKARGVIHGSGSDR